MLMPVQVIDQSLDTAAEPDATAADPVWQQFTYLEQNLLLAAFAEKPLWVPCASTADEHGHSAEPGLREAAIRMVRSGLVWFYRLDDGYPDLTPAEVDEVCSDSELWDADDEACHQIGLYLTDRGETVFSVGVDRSADVLR